MEQRLVRLEQGIGKIEDGLLDQASMITTLQDFVKFQFQYLSTYLPILEFAVDALPENSIAKLANFGMLVDHICAIQIDRVVNSQIDLNASEIAEKSGKPKSEVLVALRDLSISQKLQISASLVTTSSIARDFTLIQGVSQYSPLNRVRLWANVFSNILRFPAVADLYLSDNTLSEAEKDLLDAQSRVSDQERAFDNFLAPNWSQSLGVAQRILVETPKFLVGPKVVWLRAMQGLCVSRLVLSGDQTAGESALTYNEKLQALLQNEIYSSDEWAYRNLDSRGPGCDLTKVLESTGAPKEIRLRVVDSHTILVTSSSRAALVVVPGIFSFYTNPTLMTETGPGRALPLSNDMNAIYRFYRSPASFVASNLGRLSPPAESDLLASVRQDHQKIRTLVESSGSVAGRLIVTYGTNLSRPVLDSTKQLATTGFKGVLAYGLIYGLEQVAVAAGYSTESEPWRSIRAMIAGVLMEKLGPLSERVSSTPAEDFEERERPSAAWLGMSTEDRLADLFKRIDESGTSMKEALEEAKDQGLSEVLETSRMIRDLLLSGLSLEEIRTRLAPWVDGVS